MKNILKYLQILIILILFCLLIIGYLINKKNSQSKKNEIFNITKQLLDKNTQIKSLQKNLLTKNQDVNDLVNPISINFKKTLNAKELKNIKNSTITKYKTHEIIFNANFKASGSAYIDLVSNDKIILATYDGIFAMAKLDNINQFNKIKTNIKKIIKYNDFYLHDHYGIKDILVDDENLYVSYIDEDYKNCYDLKIIKAKINFNFLDFEELYKTPGCIKGDNEYGEFLAQQGAGGRMFKSSNNTILFTTGEFRYRTLAQDPKSYYGKIIEIDLNNNKAKIISKGHRNSQGLYYSKKENFIISTEHGPKGGDEININNNPRKKIENFGWPISSYGEHYFKNYSKDKLEKAPLKKSHSKHGFIEPIKYFVPSIGISEIIAINNDETEFLIGAMGSEISEGDLSLHYIKLNRDRTKVVDHKYEVLNERIRDMVISKDLKTVYLFLETSSSLGIINLSDN